MSQQYSLRWNNHQPNFISTFTNLLTTRTLVDVTLAAEGKQLQAHKIVLSACSTYFQVTWLIDILYPVRVYDLFLVYNHLQTNLLRYIIAAIQHSVKVFQGFYHDKYSSRLNVLYYPESIGETQLVEIYRCKIRAFMVNECKRS